jgi:hypothetical protein
MYYDKKVRDWVCSGCGKSAKTPPNPPQPSNYSGWQPFNNDTTTTCYVYN